MAFKAIILLKRRDGLSKAEFVTWWLGQHQPLAIRLKGLRRMSINIAQGDDGAYDGASELWFDSEEAFHAAYADAHGAAVAADSLSMVKRRDRMLVTEAVFVPGAGEDPPVGTVSP
jgi:uncharacterized protein (TIGR02118 family)